MAGTETLQPLEEIHKKIETEPSSLNPQVIQEAFDKVQKNLEAKFANEPAKKSQVIGQLNNLKAAWTKELTELQQKGKDKHNDAIEKTRNALNDLRSLVHPENEKRKQDIIGSVSWGRSQAKQIDDYENGAWKNKGQLGSRGQNTLSGYLAGMQMLDSSRAQQEFDKAKKLHDDYSKKTKWYDWGNILTDEDVDNLADINKYKGVFHEFLDEKAPALNDESLAFLAGYLKYSEENHANTHTEYQAYLLSRLNTFKNELTVIHAKPMHKNWAEDIATEQIKDVFSQILTPKEFGEKLLSLQTRAAQLASRVDSLKSTDAAVKIDPKINQIVAQKDTLRMEDEGKLAEAEGLLKGNVITAGNLKKTEVVKYSTEESAKWKSPFEELKKKHEKLGTKVIDENFWKSWPESLESAKSDIASFTFTDAEELDDLITKYEHLKGQKAVLDELKTQLDSEQSKYTAQKTEEDRVKAEAAKVKKEEKGTTGGTPGTTGGTGSPENPWANGKRPARVETSEGVVTNADPYKDHWENGAPAENIFDGYKGRLWVRTRRSGANLRHQDGSIFQKVPDATEVRLADPHGKGYRVDSVTFVKVRYENGVYWVPDYQLEKKDIMPNPIEPEKPETPRRKKPEQIEQEKMLNIYGEYRDAVAKVMRERENGSTDISFVMDYNKEPRGCRLRLVGNEWKLTWEGRDGQIPMSFKSIEAFIDDLDKGYISRRMAWDQILNKHSYRKYENSIGEFDNDPVQTQSQQLETYFELEWGARDADVWAVAKPHGQIEYRINLWNVGPQGEDARTGVAANFDDFMQQLSHIRKWYKNYDEDDTKPIEKKREKMYSEISNIQNFRRQEARIGHIIYANIIKINDVVSLNMDWGGGGKRDIDHNPTLNTWVNNDGTLSYILNARGLGINEGPAVVKDFDALIDKVSELKASAIQRREPSTTPRRRQRREQATEPEPEAVVKPVTEKPNSWSKETAEQKAERLEIADKLKHNLMLLTQEDKEIERRGMQIRKILDASGRLLTELKTKYPYDPDIYILEKSYNDLRGDFDRGQETDLDQSFATIEKEMQKEIQNSGVRKISMDKLSEVRSPMLKGHVDKLKKLNIQPSYVVESTNPQAKTVVLFMQTHHASEMVGGKDADKEFDEINKTLARRMKRPDDSQNQIRDAIVAAVNGGLTQTVYEEGLQNKTTADAKMLRKLSAHDKKTGSIQAKMALKDKMQLKGYDFDELKLRSMMSESDLKYRASAHNPFIASNVSDLVEASDESLSLLTIGSMHENSPVKDLKQTLPISQALAYYGMNVVVVDASSETPIS